MSLYEKYLIINAGSSSLKFSLYEMPDNIEIVNESGEENNFIFGLKVNDIENLRHCYNPWDYFNNNPDLRRVINTLVDGTFKDNLNNDYKLL